MTPDMQADWGAIANGEPPWTTCACCGRECVSAPTSDDPEALGCWECTTHECECGRCIFCCTGDHA